jgi:type II secretory pathway predicted ATPase ExeA
MYLESFGLKKKPFSLTSDPSMLYFTDSHREALACFVTACWSEKD